VGEDLGSAVAVQFEAGSQYGRSARGRAREALPRQTRRDAALKAGLDKVRSDVRQRLFLGRVRSDVLQRL